MQRAAELGKKIRIFYQRPSKYFRDVGRMPDAQTINDRGISLRSCEGLHGKFLIWDDEDVAITSFNWLATVTDGTRNRGAEIGVWVSGPEIRTMLASKIETASGGKISFA